MSKKRPPNRPMTDLYAQIEAERAAMAGPAAEVIDRFQKSILALPPFVLSDGTKVVLEPYFTPTLDEEGHTTCGIDAVLEGKGHLEFTLTNTGWGRAMSDWHLSKPKPNRFR